MGDHAVGELKSVRGLAEPLAYHALEMFRVVDDAVGHGSARAQRPAVGEGKGAGPAPPACNSRCPRVLAVGGAQRAGCHDDDVRI